MPNDTNNIAESLSCFIDTAHQAIGALGHATMLAMDALPNTKKGKQLKQDLQKYKLKCLPMSTQYLTNVSSAAERLEASAFSHFIALNLVFFDAIATPKHPNRDTLIAVVRQFTALINYTYSNKALTPIYVSNDTVELWHCTYGWLALIESGEFSELSQAGEMLRSLLDENMRSYIVGCETSDLVPINLNDIARYWGNEKKHDAVFESMFNLACCFDITFNDGSRYKSSFAQLADMVRTSSDNPEHKALLDKITTHETLLASAFKVRLLLMQCGMFRSTGSLHRLQTMLFEDLCVCQQETEGLTLFAAIDIPMQRCIVSDLINLAKHALTGSNEVSPAHIIQLTDMMRCMLSQYAAKEFSAFDRVQNVYDCISLINNLQILVSQLPSVAKAKKSRCDVELNRLRNEFSRVSVRYEPAGLGVYFIPICIAYTDFAQTQATDWVQWTALDSSAHSLCSQLVAHLIDVRPLIAYLDRAINHPDILAKERNEEFRALSMKATALDRELKAKYPVPVTIDCEAAILDSNTVLDEKLEKIVDYSVQDDHLDEAFGELKDCINKLHDHVALLHLLHKIAVPTPSRKYATMLTDAAQSLAQDGLNAFIQASFHQTQPVNTIHLLIKKICHDHYLSQLQNFIAKLESMRDRLLLEISLFGQTFALDDFATTTLISEVLNKKLVCTKALIDQRSLPNVSQLSVLNSAKDSSACAHDLRNA